MDDIDQYIADSLIGKPYGFSVGKEHFYLYPVTLGKMFLERRLIQALEVNSKYLKTNVSAEAIRLARTKKDVCLTIITYHTCKTKDEVFNTELVSKRKALFGKELSYEDIAALMMVVLFADKTESFIKCLGIDKEQERLATVMRIKRKGEKNNLTFGGLSQFGTLLDAACERYRWTKDYVVWGIDYTSLRMMLSDKITSVYVTDEELKHLPKSVLVGGNATIKADDPKNKELIQSMDWK